MNEEEIMDDEDFGYLEATEDDDSIGNLKGEEREGFFTDGLQLDGFSFPDWD